ncbi:MAG: hypothetical protein HY507_02335 [Candidatus Zambryskibacteria bacterium]|nr:hypothetical protein [Candidatus Zambryskibacteria bacterium]
MKTVTTVLLALLMIGSAFAQEPTQQQSFKPLEQLYAEWQKQDNERDLKYLGERRQEAEDELAKFNGLIAKRDGGLTEKLKRALADGDGTLIEVALDNIWSNKRELDFSAEWVIDQHGKQLMESARSAYQKELITEEQYTEHLGFFRKAKARTEEVLPESLTKMVSEAKQKSPQYFARLERIGQPYPF